MSTANKPDEATLAFEFIYKIIDFTETAFAIQCTQKILLFYKEKFAEQIPAKIYAEQLTNKLIDKIPVIITKLETDNLP